MVLASPWVQGVSVARAATDLTGSGGSFNQPFGIAVDSSGAVYVTNQGNSTSNAVEELLSGSGTWTDLTGGVTFSTPSGIAVDGSGNVYVTNQDSLGAPAVEELKNGTWTDLTQTPYSGGSFSAPSGIAVDSHGNLFVTNHGTGAPAIEELPSGQTAWQNISGSGSFNAPIGIAVDSAGDLFVANYGDGTIEELQSGGSWTDITGSGSFRNPTGIAVDSAGDLFVADFGSSKILERPSGGAWQDVTGSNTFTTPSGIAVDSAGHVYVTDSGATGGTPGAAGPVTEYTPLLPPTGLTPSGTTSTGTTLTWNAVSGATSYNVYQDGVQIASGVSSPTYAVTGLTANKPYQFTVSAVNSDGEFAQSSALTVNTTAAVPAAPTAPTLTVSGTTPTSATLTWNAVSGAATYDVYQNGNSTPIQTGLNGTSYTVTGLTAGTSYSFTVTAVNSGGASSPSNSVTANPVNTGSIDLKFGSTSLQSGASTTVTGVVYENNAPFSNAVVNLSSTIGYWGSSGTTSSETVTADVHGSFSTTWTAPTVTATTTGSATASVTGAVYGVTPATVSISLTPSIVAPSQPTGLSASGTTSTSTTLTWTAVSGATSYNVYKNNSGTPMKTGITGATYTVTGLNSGTSYSFKVSAVNSGGESPQSSAVTVTTAAPPIYHRPTFSSNTQIADKPSDSQKYVWSVDNSKASLSVSVVNGSTAAALLGAIQSTDGSAQTYAVQDGKGQTVNGTTVVKDGDVLVVTAADGQTTADYTVSTWMEVSTAAQLEQIDKNQGNYLNANIRLMNDIDLTGYSWTPIGGNDYGTFIGTFDGQGHKVTGLSVGNLSWTAKDFGFFGKTSGTIENVGVAADMTVTGMFDGSLAGEQDGGSITNSYGTGSVRFVAAFGGNSTTGTVGGLVGMQNSGSIKASYATASVNAATGGGLVGEQKGGSINASSASGAVSGVFGMPSVVGGLVGSQGGGTIGDSYVTGKVSGHGPGGLVGSQTGGTIRSSYFDKDTTGQSNGVGKSTSSTQSLPTGITGESDSAMKKQATFQGWDFTKTWAMSPSVNGGYPYLRPFTAKASRANDTQIQDKQSDNHRYVWTVDNTEGSLSVSVVNGSTASQLTGAIEATDGSAQTYTVHDAKGQDVSSSTALKDGDVLEVTAEDGQTIADYTVSTWMAVSTAAQLEQIDKNQGNYLNVNIKLMNDIDLTGYSWTPIGGNNYGPFTGTFDGQGHEVTGLTINETNVPAGFFGISSGKIENLGVDVAVSATTGGGLVGQQNGGSISNSYATGSVSGGYTSTAGGLVGIQNSGSITGSYATASVNAATGGGLVGEQKGGSINASSASGAVNGMGLYHTVFVMGTPSVVGGLVGSQIGGSIGDSYATGTVSGDGPGGLVGSQTGGTISDSYATGKVVASIYAINGYTSSYLVGVGGIVGYQDKGTISDSYFDKDTTGQSNGVGKSTSSTQSLPTGITGESDSAMKTQSTFQGWDFAKTWAMSTSVNSGYAYLQALSPQTSTASQTFGSSGGTMQQKLGNQTVSVNVPDGAFQTQEAVKVSLVPLANVTQSMQGLGTSSVAAVLDVSFSGASPTKPVTVTITNSSIKAGGVVYKQTSDGKLVPLKATVVDGKATVSFMSDPTFVVVNLKQNERIITMAGQASIVPRLAQAESAHGNKTTYMPIWYVMQLLKQAGIHSTWDGTNWRMTTSGQTNLSRLTVGHGKTTIYLNGTVVQKVDTVAAKDPSTGKATTYMPIWYVTQLLKRAELQSTWDGTTWTLSK